MSSFLIKKKKIPKCFLLQALGDSGFQAVGECHPREEEDIQTRQVQVLTAGWLGWGLGSPDKEAAILLNSGKL